MQLFRELTEVGEQLADERQSKLVAEQVARVLGQEKKP